MAAIAVGRIDAAFFESLDASIDPAATPMENIASMSVATAGVAFNLRCLIASLVALERMDEARGVAQQILRMQPAFRLSSYRLRCPFKGNTLDTWINRLRQAGLPD